MLSIASPVTVFEFKICFLHYQLASQLPLNASAVDCGRAKLRSTLLLQLSFLRRFLLYQVITLGMQGLP